MVADRAITAMTVLVLGPFLTSVGLATVGATPATIGTRMTIVAAQ